MTTRRRWIAGLGLGFLGVGLAVVALNSRSERPDVQLLFIDYTNVSSGCFLGGRPSTFSLRKAVLMVTNCGSVSVRLLPIWDAHGRTNMIAHFITYVHRLPSVLKPGESARAELFSSGRDVEFYRAELAYSRLDLAHGLSQRARSSTNAAVRAVAKFLLRSPKPRWVHSESIPNTFAYRSRYHITAPPPPVSYDMLFAPQRD